MDIMCVIYLIVYAIILLVLLWAIREVLTAFNITPDPRIARLITVLIVLLLLVWFLQCLGLLPAMVGSPGHHLYWRD